METHKQLTIGLFGFGVVGEGLYKVLQQTPSLKASIKRVCIKNADKKREAPADLFTTDRDIILNDPQINVIVEVINESGPAFEIVSRALKSGKAVVSASKKMIAEHLSKDEIGAAVHDGLDRMQQIIVIIFFQVANNRDRCTGSRFIEEGGTGLLL